MIGSNKIRNATAPNRGANRRKQYIINAAFQWRDLETFADGTEVHYYLRIRLASGFSIWTGPVYVTYDQSAVIAVEGPPATGHLSLATPYPNPGRGTVSINFALPPGADRAKLAIYDPSGRLVRSLMHRPAGNGPQTVSWDGRAANGSAVPTGIYFIRLETGETSVTKKMLYLR